MAQTIGFNDLNDPENQNNQQNQQGSNTPAAGQSGNLTGGTGAAAGGTQNNTGQSSGVSAGSAPSGGNAPTVARPATYNQQNQGTGFQNLQNYVQANNPSQLQQTIAQGLQNQNQSVLNNLGTAQQQFGQQQSAAQANTNANQQAIQSVLSNPAAFTNPQTNVPTGSGTTTPSSGTTPSQSNLAQGNLFGQLMSGQYNGPTALNNLQGLQGQAQAAQQSAQGLQTAGGRQAVLQQILGSPGYNTGEQQLDAALLGQGSSPALNAAATQANALGSIVGQAGAAAAAQGQEQQNAAQQFGAQTQGQFGNTVQNLNAQLQQQAGAAQGNQNAAYQQLLTDATNNTLTPQEASLLGLTQGEQVTQNDLNNIQAYATQSQLQANAQNIASGQNYATIDALRNLAGNNAPAAAAATLGQYQGQEGQAGTFAAQPQANVNTAALGNAISTDTGAYNTALNNAQGALGTDQALERWSAYNSVTGPGQNGLNANDYKQAQQWGIDPSLIASAQSGNTQAQAQLGQTLWQTQLKNTYGNGPDNNSQFLNNAWATGQTMAAQTNLQNVQNQLNSQYGGLDTINTNPTTGALQAMANGTQINPGGNT